MAYCTLVLDTNPCSLIRAPMLQNKLVIWFYLLTYGDKSYVQDSEALHLRMVANRSEVMGSKNSPFIAFMSPLGLSPSNT